MGVMEAPFFSRMAQLHPRVLFFVLFGRYEGKVAKVRRTEIRLPTLAYQVPMEREITGRNPAGSPTPGN